MLRPQKKSLSRVEMGSAAKPGLFSIRYARAITAPPIAHPAEKAQRLKVVTTRFIGINTQGCLEVRALQIGLPAFAWRIPKSQNRDLGIPSSYPGGSHAGAKSPEVCWASTARLKTGPDTTHRSGSHADSKARTLQQGRVFPQPVFAHKLERSIRSTPLIAEANL